MSSRYRVEYALKVHRRDEFIEWIKGLLAVPFVLHAVQSPSSPCTDTKTSGDARRRYAEIFADIERLVADQQLMQLAHTPELGRLRQLVPSVGEFFTKLPLERAFYVEDERRSISVRRLVCPSFNDIRLILNTAQAMQLAQSKIGLKLVTFDGDVTLYEDGKSLTPDAAVVSRLLVLLKKDICVGVVTAAGYNEKDGDKYYERLRGLVDAIRESKELTNEQKERFTVMGGESNYLFRYNCESEKLQWIDPDEWLLDSMRSWQESDIDAVLDLAEITLKELQTKLNLPATVMRKHRAVGVIPNDGAKLTREQLEEVVLSVQRRLDVFPAAQRVQFCAFDGGSDVWVDIASKDLGVASLQKYFGGIGPHETLHIGDQFTSVGSNDYKARLAGCTCWIANPEETVAILDDLVCYFNQDSGLQ